MLDLGCELTREKEQHFVGTNIDQGHTASYQPALGQPFSHLAPSISYIFPLSFQPQEAIIVTSSKMSKRNDDALINESINGEEKDDNQDKDVEETVVSDDDLIIDYSVKPEFYDPNLDDKDQLWIQKKRKGQYSDAVLSCPACFTTLCLECQRHEKYVTQYRAVFVVNCKMKKGGVSNEGSLKRKRVRKGGSGGGESFTPVCCSVCQTEVGVIDDDEVYHFFNVLPSEC